MVAVLAAVALAASACRPSSTGARQGGILRIGTSTGIDSLNPFVALQPDAYSTFEYLYPYLVQYDTTNPDLPFAPDFARSWSVSPDGLVWTFHTVADARWSDGVALTANDVAWTFSTIRRLAGGPAVNLAGLLAHVRSVTAPNPTTVVVTYDRPVANALADLQQIPILPQHVWGVPALHDGRLLRSVPNVPTIGHPVVSGGPFDLVQYRQGHFARFTRNPNFYGPAPRISGFYLEFYANDQQLVAALQGGQVDAVEGIPPTAVQGLRSAGFDVATRPGLEFRDLIFNSNPRKPRNRELLNPLVREAFEYAIDRQKILQDAWLGYGQVGGSIVPPATGAWNDASLQPLPYDPQRATQILDSLGYRMGPNGIRVAGGHPMSYQVIFPEDESGPGNRAFQIIQSDLRLIGVQVTQRVASNAQAFADISAPNGRYLDFDLAMWNWVPLEDPDFILSVLTCGTYGSWNDTGYCSPQYDRLYAEQARTMNQAARRQIVDQMQQLVAAARPYIVLAYNDVIDAWSAKWSGFVESNQGLFNPLSKQGLEQVHYG